MGSLCFVGLGLHDEKDISVKGLERVRNADHVFMENYTAVLVGTDRERMERFYGRSVELLSREDVEDGSVILDAAEGTVSAAVVLLVVGDALTATTHDSLRADALRRGIRVDVIHGASIATAVSLLGLQNYRFGRTTTLVFPEPKSFPLSPYDVIRANRDAGLHTLVLLDIRAHEERFMTIHDAVDVLGLMEAQQQALGVGGLITPDMLICAVCRAGSSDPFLWAGALQDAKDVDFGPPLHTLVIPAELNFAEKESLESFTGMEP